MSCLLLPRRVLNTDAKLQFLRVTGMRIEIVRCAPVELVARAEFAAQEQAESKSTGAGRDPAYGFEQACFTMGRDAGK